MKRAAAVAAGVLTLAVIALQAQAGEKPEASTGNTCSSGTVASLIAGIQSDNQGLRESAAFVLGEIKCTAAVIPLMRMLHDEKAESSRIAAALALSLIGEPRGVYAVKRAATFDNSPRVRVLSAYFYNAYVHPATFAFQAGDAPDAAHDASN